MCHKNVLFFAEDGNATISIQGQTIMRMLWIIIGQLWISTLPAIKAIVDLSFSIAAAAIDPFRFEIIWWGPRFLFWKAQLLGTLGNGHMIYNCMHSWMSASVRVWCVGLDIEFCIVKHSVDRILWGNPSNTTFLIFCARELPSNRCGLCFP